MANHVLRAESPDPRQPIRGRYTGTGLGGEDPPPTGGAPAPGPGDLIRLDTRTSLQTATNLTQALQAVSQPSGAVDATGNRSALGGNGWSFNSNFNGAGKKALVANLTAQAGDQGIHFINYLANPKPRRLYIQWRSRLGKHPSDPNANGTNNDFPMYPQGNSMKRLLVLRDGVGGGDMHRWDYVWTRANPTQLRSQIDHQNWSSENSGGWSAHNVVAQEILTTAYFQAATVNVGVGGTSNGIVRIWINDTLQFERTNVPAQTNAFDRWQLPTVYHDVPRACAEYVWDLLVWEPA